MKKINITGNVFLATLACSLGLFILSDSINSKISLNFGSIMQFIGSILLILTSIGMISIRYRYSDDLLLIKLLWINTKIELSSIDEITKARLGLYQIYTNQRCYSIVLFFGKKDIFKLFSKVLIKNPKCILS